MRYYPAALALSLVAAISSSVIHSATSDQLDPRAAALLAQGRTELAAGRIDPALDAFESALVVSPGSAAVLVSLGEAQRAQGLQGKALHYYREALEADPRNTIALAGEGEALAEKGALEKARRNLARLKTICGGDCKEVRELASAIERVPPQRIVSAEAAKPAPIVSDN